MLNGSAPGRGVDVLHEPGELRRVGVGQHAVPQVEHVARSAAGLGQHAVGFALRSPPSRRQEHRGVEVALDALVRADPPPRVVQPDPPVHADEVRPGGCDLLEHPADAGAEVDRGNTGLAHGVEDAPVVGQHVGLVCGRSQVADPRVEQLQHLRPGLHLRVQVADRHLGQGLHELRPQRGLAVHEGLRPATILAGLALDHVRGQRVRRPREPHDRGAAVQLASHHPERLEDLGGRLFGLDDPKGTNGGRVAHGRRG